MKYLIIILFLSIGCNTTKKNAEPPDDPYWSEEIGHNGDTTFWKNREAGFVLTNSWGVDSTALVVRRIDRLSKSWSVWENVPCDSAKWKWKGSLGTTASSRCMTHKSKETEVWYEIPENGCRSDRKYVLLPHEKYILENEWCYVLLMGKNYKY